MIRKPYGIKVSRTVWRDPLVGHLRLDISQEPDPINIDDIYKWLEKSFIINEKKKPICKNSLIQTKPSFIIFYYNSIAKKLLYFFQYTDNINIIKKIITYHLQYSLLFTLARKHKCSIKQIFKVYSKKIRTLSKENQKISFINSTEILNFETKLQMKKYKIIIK